MRRRDVGILLERLAKPRITHVDLVGHLLGRDVGQHILAHNAAGLVDFLGHRIVGRVIVAVVVDHVGQDTVRNRRQHLLAAGLFLEGDLQRLLIPVDNVLPETDRMDDLVTDEKPLL